MKIKKLIIAFMVAICSVMFVACTTGSTTNVVATNLGIYDLYYDYMAKTKDDIGDDISSCTELDYDQASYITMAMLYSFSLENEELAIIASIECYNMVSSPKEINLNIDNGLINVKQDNKNYICTVTNDGSVTSYSFSISKSAQTGVYDIRYTKTLEEEISCTAKVVFDKDSSYISTDITSFAIDQNIQVKKEFYSLVNNNKAFKVSTAVGSGSNRFVYNIDYYKEVLTYNIKVSNSHALSENISKDNLTKDKFVASNSNDFYGHIIRTDEQGKNATVTTFGDLADY